MLAHGGIDCVVLNMLLANGTSTEIKDPPQFTEMLTTYCRNGNPVPPETRTMFETQFIVDPGVDLNQLCLVERSKP